jgi:uncharacterized protein
LWNQKAICSVDATHPLEATERTVKTSSSQFFILVFVLSVPFYILGATGAKLPGLPFLPASALMGFVPAIAALIIVHRQRGSEGAVAFLKSTFLYERNRGAGWILVAFLFMPVVRVLEFGVLRLTGSGVPNPQIEPIQAIFYFIAFFTAAIGEELGWQGYAYPGLRTSQTVLGSALILGIVWALWHLIPFVEMGRSTSWIFWHLLGTVLLRFIIVWLFENTGQSIFIAVMFHTMINLSLALFPVAGSFYDPFVTFLISTFAVIAIFVCWRPKVKLGKKPS